MPYGSLAAKQFADRLESLYRKFDNTEAIDAHSHFGNDRFWINNGDVDLYVKRAKENGINAALAMSVPCPVFKEDNKEEILSY